MQLSEFPAGGIFTIRLDAAGLETSVNFGWILTWHFVLRRSDASSRAIPAGPQNYQVMSELLERISVNPEQCGGKPCIRGMRIRVVDVLCLLAAGLTVEQVLEEMPDLEADDLKAVFAYAAQRMDHPALAA